MSDCQKCKDSIIPFVVDPLPCVNTTCDTAVDLNCVLYTGPNKPCAGIVKPMTVNQVLQQIAQFSGNCDCSVEAVLTFQKLPCDKGIQLAYNDYTFAVQWQYLDSITNTYVDVNNNLIVKSSDEDFYYQNLPSGLLADLKSDNYKITLTKPGCDPVVKTLFIGTTCQTVEPCVLEEDAYVKDPHTGERLYAYYSIPNVDTKTQLKLLCDTFPFMTKSECLSFYDPVNFSYQALFSIAYNQFLPWQQDRIDAVMTDNTVALSQTLPIQLPPQPHPTDIYNDGPLRATDPNYNWIKVPIKSCPCKLGNDPFYVKYLPSVVNVTDLPLQAVLGNVVYVSSEDEYYTWNPQTQLWVKTWTFTDVNGIGFSSLSDTNYGAASDFDECRQSVSIYIQGYLKGLKEYSTAVKPYLWSSLLSMHRIYDAYTRNKFFSNNVKGNGMCDCNNLPEN